MIVKRAAFFIDGYNFFMGLKTSGLYAYAWLDQEKMCTALLNLARQVEPNGTVAYQETLEYIKWFTAIPSRISFDRQNPIYLADQQEYDKQLKHYANKAKRHQRYVDALEVECPKLCPPVLGSFATPADECTIRKHPFFSVREKRTDVSICAHLMSDAYYRKYDVAYLVSGDSDLVDPVRIINKVWVNGCRAQVWFPPNRTSSHLQKIGSGKTIPRQIIINSQLPNPVVRPDGSRIYKPLTWV